MIPSEASMRDCAAGERKCEMVKVLSILAIAGDVAFVLWMTWNAIDERGQGATGPQVASYLGLTVVLTLNAVLVWRGRGVSS